ncbi:hypothetical protein [Solimicrobium silvestre]|jgi:hypothetical protein|uniref:Uncharacterized protein n=1 Tax=Solimicrobium silvestre TaxID=2099400 RepID=A0A2S9GU29_9BURK|nr:hypothetical protein [Solimicrobium silvestre]PRC91166.1 hypothetical protein S2091_4167 [Solimicrobium silvestre]
MDQKWQRVIDAYTAKKNAENAFQDAIESISNGVPSENFDREWLIANMAKCKSEFEAAIENNQINS